MSKLGKFPPSQLSSFSLSSQKTMIINYSKGPQFKVLCFILSKISQFLSEYPYTWQCGLCQGVSGPFGVFLLGCLVDFSKT